MDEDNCNFDLEPYLKHANGVMDVRIEVGPYSKVRKMTISGPNPKESHEELIYKVLNPRQSELMYKALMDDLNHLYDTDPEWEDFLYRRKHCLAIREYDQEQYSIPESLTELVDIIRYILFECAVYGEKDRNGSKLLFQWYKENCIVRIK